MASGAIEFVRARSSSARRGFRHADRPGFLDPSRMTAEDSTNIAANAASWRVRRKPLAAEDFETALAWNMADAGEDPRDTSRRARSTTRGPGER
jgi:hypothetical protein